MKKENRKIMKEIMQNSNLEMNLPAYANAYINATYEYSLIRLVLNYYTVKEISDEEDISFDDFLEEILSKIHNILTKTVLSDKKQEDYELVLQELHAIREEMINRMTILTFYTDALQIYEYILNRVEYSITKETFPVDEGQLGAKIVQYLFSDKDKVVMNSRIQLITGQLPIRMTKQRFFDYLTDTINIYKGSDKSAVDSFLTMLKSTALLEKPKGYNDAYPQMVELINRLEQTDFEKLELEEYKELIQQFEVVTDRLTEYVSNYLLVQEVINNVYVLLLGMPYEKNNSRTITVCTKMIQGLNQAFIEKTPIPDEVTNDFALIEGKQEILGEDVMQYESILPEVMKEQKDTISWIMAEKIFNSLSLISKLLSSSLFIDLSEKGDENEVAEDAYIDLQRDQLVASLSELFAQHTKEFNRAIMAALFSNMPVLFNSQKEIMEYIRYSLEHCKNPSELMACAKILEELMNEV